MRSRRSFFKCAIPTLLPLLATPCVALTHPRSPSVIVNDLDIFSACVLPPEAHTKLVVISVRDRMPVAKPDELA